MKLFNKILTYIYSLILILYLIYGSFYYLFKLETYHQTVLTAYLGILVALGIFVFALIHWFLSKNTLGIFREKVLVTCSSVNLILILSGVVALGTCSDASCMIILPIEFFLAISTVLTLLFGIISIPKANRVSLFWIFFVTIVSGLLVFVFDMN